MTKIIQRGSDAGNNFLFTGIFQRFLWLLFLGVCLTIHTEGHYDFRKGKEYAFAAVFTTSYYIASAWYFGSMVIADLRAKQLHDRPVRAGLVQLAAWYTVAILGALYLAVWPSQTLFFVIAWFWRIPQLIRFFVYQRPSSITTPSAVAETSLESTLRGKREAQIDYKAGLDEVRVNAHAWQWWTCNEVDYIKTANGYSTEVTASRIIAELLWNGKFRVTKTILLRWDPQRKEDEMSFFLIGKLLSVAPAERETIVFMCDADDMRVFYSALASETELSGRDLQVVRGGRAAFEEHTLVRVELRDKRVVTLSRDFSTTKAAADARIVSMNGFLPPPGGWAAELVRVRSGGATILPSRDHDPI